MTNDKMTKRRHTYTGNDEEKKMKRYTYTFEMTRDKMTKRRYTFTQNDD